MSAVQPPVIVPRGGRPPEDDLDGLLRAYFQAEVPDPWPSFEAPVARNGVMPPRRAQLPPRRFNLWRSRLALAASVLLLIGGGLFLFGNSVTPDAVNKPDPQNSSAEKDKLPPGESENIVVTPEGSSFKMDIPLGGMPMK